MTCKLQTIGPASHGRGVAGFVDVIGLIYRAPEPVHVKGVAELSGHCVRVVARYIYLLKEEGLVAQVGKRGKTNLYSWNPELRRD